MGDEDDFYLPEIEDLEARVLAMTLKWRHEESES